MTFKESASTLPTEQEAIQGGGIPAQQQVILPTDPRSAALASEIRSKLKKAKSSQSTPTPKSGEGTARSTPSS